MIYIPTHNLRIALKAVLPYAADEPYRPALHAVHWRAAADRLVLTAADGWIIGEYTVPCEIDEDDDACAGLVPFRGCKAILEWIKDRTDVHLAIVGDAIHVANHDERIRIDLWTKTKAPDYARAFTTAEKGAAHHWNGPIWRFFEFPAETLGNYQVLSFHNVSFDLKLWKRSLRQYPRNEHIRIQTGNPTAPALVTGAANWRAAIMPMTRGMR